MYYIDIDLDRLWDEPDLLVKVVDHFITHLAPNHQVSGDVYYTLLGIASWARENKYLTSKQISYVIHNLYELQDQLDLFRL